MVLLFVATLTSVICCTWRTHARRVESSRRRWIRIEQLEQLRERLHYTESQWQTLKLTAAQERRASEDKLQLEAAEQRMCSSLRTSRTVYSNNVNQTEQHQQSLQATLAPFKVQLALHSRCNNSIAMKLKSEPHYA